MTKDKLSLDPEIERIKGDLAFEDTGSEVYEQKLRQLVTLYELNKKKKLNISGDTIVMATVNLLGILLILKHEQLNVVSSKALGFVSKLRL